jgi:hypothetical protein
MSILIALKLPFKIIINLVRNKRKREKGELERKQLAYVRNFSPAHYCWQQRTGKKLVKKRKRILSKKIKVKQ